MIIEHKHIIFQTKKKGKKLNSIKTLKSIKLTKKKVKKSDYVNT